MSGKPNLNNEYEKKKHDNMKTTPLCNRKIPTNANTQKLKKAQSEFTNAYLKEQTSKTRSIRLETRSKVDNLG